MEPRRTTNRVRRNPGETAEATGRLTHFRRLLVLAACPLGGTAVVLAGLLAWPQPLSASGLYARYRLLVAYLIEREGVSVEDLLRLPMRQEEAERRLLADTTDSQKKSRIETTRLVYGSAC